MPNPKEVPSPCHCLNLRRAAQSVTALYEASLRDSHLSLAQFTILRYLHRLGPASVSELATAMGLDRTTLVRTLKPLEAGGLALDLAPPGSRNRQLGLTAQGRERLEQAMAGWQRAQERMAAALAPEDWARYIGLLQVIQGLKP
jgi:DNA-binding MarR family transcriptional regulator